MLLTLRVSTAGARLGFLVRKETTMPLRSALAVALLLFATGVSAETIPPSGYAFKAAEPCIENPERASKPQRPGDAVYRACDDQMAILSKGLEQAKAQGKLLLVTFGAPWCPVCANLQKLLPADGVLRHKGDALDYGHTFHHIEIALSTLHKGKITPIPSGDAVLSAVLFRAPGTKLRAIPFLAVIDPVKPDRAWARNMDDVYQADGKIEAQRMRALLGDAHAYLTSGGPAPNEPGWFRRKLTKWFGI